MECLITNFFVELSADLHSGTKVKGMSLQLGCLLIKLLIEWHFKYGKGLPYGSFKVLKF